MWKTYFLINVSFISFSQTNKNDTAEGEEIQNENESFETEARPSDKRRLQEDDKTEAQSAKVARFKLDDSADEFNWDLPNNLLDYYNKYSSLRIPEKDIK